MDPTFSAQPIERGAHAKGSESPAGYRGGEGRDVVLLHGFTATWRCWLPVVPALTEHFSVFAPTLAGHYGGPESSEDGHGLIDAGDQLESLLTEAGIESAHLVGNSMGGTLALELARRGRAQSIVAFSPAGGWHPGDREDKRIEQFFRRQLQMTKDMEPRLPRLLSRPAMRRLLLRDVAFRGDRLPVAEAVAMCRSSLRCSVTEQAYRALRSGNAALTDLGRIDAPTLIVWPLHDRVLPVSRHLRRFRSEIPGVTIRIMPGVGHVPMRDEPELVAKTITDWIRAHDRRREGPTDAQSDVDDLVAITSPDRSMLAADRVQQQQVGSARFHLAPRP